MTRWLILALVLPSAASFAQEPKDTPAPPFIVDVTCNTTGIDPQIHKAFKQRIKDIAVYAKEIKPGPKRPDKQGWELWSFEVAGESKFDPSIFQRAFADIKCQKFQLTFTGTATQDPQTKVILLTSAKGTAKVKLMNGRRDPFKPEQEVEDIVGRVSAALAKGKKEFTVKGEIFSHGGTLALLLEECSAGSAIVEEEKPKAHYPPYVVTVTAKTKFAGVDKMQALQKRLKDISVYATQVSRQPLNDNAGWEKWTFEISSENKLDSTLIARAFAGLFQCKRYDVRITGTATQDPQSKIIHLTAFGDKVKAKLMNRPKDASSPDQQAEDVVSQVSEAIAKGKKHFMVEGELYSHGGALAILVESFSPTSPPK